HHGYYIINQYGSRASDPLVFPNRTQGPSAAEIAKSLALVRPPLRMPFVVVSPARLPRGENPKAAAGAWGRCRIDLYPYFAQARSTLQRALLLAHELAHLKVEALNELEVDYLFLWGVAIERDVLFPSLRSMENPEEDSAETLSLLGMSQPSEAEIYRKQY